MNPPATTLVSVALCTHNGSRFIEEQLLSILAQIRRPDYIVISDDASTDGSVEIAESVYARWRNKHPESPPQLSIFRNPTVLGVTQNFEHAVSQCSGELIVLSDQDDVWQPDRLSVAVARFEESPALDLLFSDARLVGSDGEPLGRSLLDTLEVSDNDKALIHRGKALVPLIRRNLVTGATVMFRRRLLESARPFPSGWVHDEWLAIVAATRGQIDLVELPLIDYRLHGSNQIGVVEPSLLYKLRRVFASRGDRNLRLARQFQQLVERAELWPDISPDVLQIIRGKAEAEAHRAALPSMNMARVPGVIAGVRKGWYRDFSSRGRLDILRDLAQPH
jgi:glycosyltransferase involved in cell wall biosynthesis